MQEALHGASTIGASLVGPAFVLDTERVGINLQDCAAASQM